MVGKSISECLSVIKENLSAIESMSGSSAGDSDADDMEMAERPVGRGRKRRPAPFMRKKADAMEESNEDSE